jgi:hypothetical protein
MAQEPANLTIKKEIPNLLTNNYIYISHMDEDYQFWRLPTDPDTIADSFPAAYSSTPALGRSAPVFTYTGSGPRDVQITLNMHRDMMDDINMGNISPYKTKVVDGKEEKDYFFKEGEDYIDALIRALQSISVPKYTEANNIVEPPIVAVRFGNEIFVRGIVDSGVNVQYSKPILSNDKYAQVQVSFNIKEIDPYDAPTVFKNGSFRGLVATMRTGMGFSLDK